MIEDLQLHREKSVNVWRRTMRTVNFLDIKEHLRQLGFVDPPPGGSVVQAA